MKIVEVFHIYIFSYLREIFDLFFKAKIFHDDIIWKKNDYLKIYQFLNNFLSQDKNDDIRLINNKSAKCDFFYLI